MVNPIIVATDGSALANPSGPAGWAWYVDGQSWQCGGFPKASNNYAELSAVLAALKNIPEKYPLRILTDSQYIVKIFGVDGKSGYLKNWKKNGWKKGDGEEPANLKIIQAIHVLITRRPTAVVLEWVKGHNGHPLNTLADKLCTQVSGLIAKGKNPPPSPGWRENSIRKPLKAPRTAESIPRGKRVAKKTVRPVEGAPGARLRRRQDYADPFGESDYDEADDLSYIKRQEEARQREKQLYGTTVLCPSCGTPISPLTNECKCSF